MSNKEYEFDIDDILSEFHAEQAAQEASPSAQEASFATPETPPSAPESARRGAAERQEERSAGRTARTEKERRGSRSEQREKHPAAVQEALFQTPEVLSQPERAGHGRGRRPEPYPDLPEDAGGETAKPARDMTFFISLGRAVLSLAFGLLALLVLSWMLLNVHPDPAAQSASPSGSRLDLLSEFNNFVNNAASDALSDLTYIRKIYTIPENATSAPAPNPANFGSTTDPQVIMDLIASAAGLMDGQTAAFNPDAQFQEGKEIRYYYDETILAITWKEIIEGKCCSCAEIKVANGSQIRRKLANDTYGSSVQLYASDMAKAAKAVVAINGDFYAFRPIGITAYQREIFRCNSPTLDTCFFTASGDMLFSYAGEHTDWDETQQFVNDNDVLWAITFGPILVDNGELRTIDSYPIGEINSNYSRAAIGMLDQLHYFLMTVNYDDGYSVSAPLSQFSRFLHDKGCQKAYALDGGQTSVLLMNGELVNHVDFGYERTMSDIIYFGTALPEEEANQ